ncbi:MAG: FtsW/RodA/SpoVE family cell cycle protein, partial [Clostridia bacterium]|nr:FtsW/RodA/SpoVE family cell cycle protein [Clostridia bacterium]
HLSGIIILGAIGVIVMFLAGSDGRHLLTLMGVAVVGVSCLAIFTDYTKRRIDIFLDPYAMRLEGGWQTIQGLNAIGSGGLLGLGIGDSRMKYSWVSEPANDFIFTITCEELGFVGAIAIIAFFALFVWRGYVIAMHNPDIYARLLCAGIITKVAVQTLLNFAVITNSIPNTGIPLPFFSYGGTSLIIQLLEVGIVLSISRTSQLQKR